MDEIEIFRTKLSNIDIKPSHIPFNMLHKAFQYAYQKENLHSQLLAGLLRPIDNNYTALSSFLSKLGVNSYKTQDCESVKITLERNVNRRRIDIFIEWQDENKKQYAVIIENKLNGASDQRDQLNDYHKGITAEGYSVEKVVYLCFNAHNPYNVNEKVNAKLKITDIQWLIEWIDYMLKNMEGEDYHWTIVKQFGPLYQYKEFLDCLKSTNFIKMKALEIIEKCSIDEINKLQYLATIVSKKEWYEARFSPLSEKLKQSIGERLEIKYDIGYAEFFFRPYKEWIELQLKESNIELYIVSYHQKKEIKLSGKTYLYDSPENGYHYYYEEGVQFDYPIDNPKLLNTMVLLLAELSKYKG
jgi:hypothetical protein